MTFLRVKMAYIFIILRLNILLFYKKAHFFAEYV